MSFALIASAPRATVGDAEARSCNARRPLPQNPPENQAPAPGLGGGRPAASLPVPAPGLDFVPSRLRKVPRRVATPLEFWHGPAANHAPALAAV
jgi:hypothetical protein